VDDTYLINVAKTEYRRASTPEMPTEWCRCLRRSLRTTPMAAHVGGPGLALCREGDKIAVRSSNRRSCFLVRCTCVARCRNCDAWIIWAHTASRCVHYKHIIHDWPDDACIKILKACRQGVNPGGKLLVVDCVIGPGNYFSSGKFLDLQMLIFPGGRERTEPNSASCWQRQDGNGPGRLQRRTGFDGRGPASVGGFRKLDPGLLDCIAPAALLGRLVFVSISELSSSASWELVQIICVFCSYKLCHRCPRR
jgi:hypothetical protein